MSQKFYLAIIAILLCISIGLACWKVNKKINIENEPKPVEMTLEQAKDVERVKNEINNNSGARVDNFQAKEVVDKIVYITENNEPPQTIIYTNGENYKEESKQYAEKKKADAVIITPSQGETKKIEDIKPTDTVNLNQYNIKAYPKNQIGVAYYSDGDMTVDYQRQIKVFGAHMYIGPAVKFNTRGEHHAAVGVKLTVPF